MQDTDPTFWKRKLAAFLHDPPEKALDLAWHKRRAEAHEAGLLLEDTVFSHDCDHSAAAADRLPWPRYQHLECSFDGALNFFKHPLGKASLKIAPFKKADVATDSAWASRPMLDHVTQGVDFDRAQFFAFWRLWRWWSSDKRNPHDPRMAFLPADTRLPDHSIWAHISLVSALQACVEDGRCHPAFLLFNIGPVQDFIASARRTLDLWSGSYLLSYLTASALRHIALSLGPDQIIFPNLCGQPIFDLLLKDEIWTKSFVTKESDESLWSSFRYDSAYSKRRLLTPSLPNRFLALVPTSQAETIAREVKQAVVDQLRAVARSVWELAKNKIDPLQSVAAQEPRFFAQVERHLEVSWQTLPWSASPDAAVKLSAPLPDKAAVSGLETILNLARKMPKDHRDVRNFYCERFPDGSKVGWKDKSKLKDNAPLDNPGSAWSALYALLNWQLDGVRQNRAWKAWIKGVESVGLMNEKDSLTGKEEAILNLASAAISDDDVKQISRAIGPAKLFKKGEVLGAITLIKRLWPFAWLKPKHEFGEGLFRFPDTRLIAQGRPFDDSDEENEDREDGPAYFAVLAFDGDEMGKWISGNHPDLPTLGDLLADYEQNGKPKGARKYFEDHEALKHLLDAKRPLNPSFHLQFSEMLGTFANVCARRIVEAFDGCLIYSGGDDVLALLPSDKALECARTLRAAFRGTKDLNCAKGAWEVDHERGHREKNANLPLFQVEQEGFIQLHPDNFLVMEGEPRAFPAIVPGPSADCSVGIAIAHFKSPLQDVVRAAQRAEKRAKSQLGRAAVAVSLFKRSGEITEWGTKWESGGLALYEAIARALETRSLTGKSPHRVCQLLEPYLISASGLMRDKKTIQDANGFDALEIIRKEFAFAISRQSTAGKQKENDEMLLPLLNEYLTRLAAAWQKREDARGDKDKGPPASMPQELLTAVIGICSTVAFAHRTETEAASHRLKGN